MNFRTLFILLLSILLLGAAGVIPLAAAEQGQLDASEPLFTVLAAANAAGYDAGLATSPPLRQQVRDRIAAAKAPVVAELRAWYKENPERDKTQDLARFISLGVSLKDAPDFEWAKRTVEVPPDAMAMDEFRKMLPRFYEQAKIAELWAQSQRAVDKALEQYQEPIAKVVLEANGYLRNSTSGYFGRRFQIFLDFLGAPNQVQTRSFGDDFFVVLTPSTEMHLVEIRHAYFRFLLDPLSIKYGEDLKAKASLEDIAQEAPLLNDPYRSSFDLLASECLIKAIESRLLSNPSLVDQALREGFILTPFFNEQLAVYEKSQESMRLFFPKMIQTLNVKHEMRRLEGVQFAKELPKLPAAKQVIVAQPEGSVAARTIVQADEAYYDKKDMEQARALYRKALEQPGSANEHAKSYYGLAHIALMQKNPEEADQLFRRTLESSPAPETEAWSCYYLGKLSQAADEQDEAKKWFRKALDVKGASPKAIESARRELALAAPAGK